jgi:hypothetical protein
MEPSPVGTSIQNRLIDVAPEEVEARASLLERAPQLSSSATAEPAPAPAPAVARLVERASSTPAALPPKNDWCGSDGTGWVPDGMLGVDWSDACKTHDDCYAAAGANKFLCDYTLQQDISLACAAQDGGILCDVVAGIYFHGVRAPQGEDAFERAQAAAGPKAP